MTELEHTKALLARMREARNMSTEGFPETYETLSFTLPQLRVLVNALANWEAYLEYGPADSRQ